LHITNPAFKLTQAAVLIISAMIQIATEHKIKVAFESITLFYEKGQVPILLKDSLRNFL